MSPRLSERYIGMGDGSMFSPVPVPEVVECYLGVMPQLI
jgi:hypothetical protein